MASSRLVPIVTIDPRAANQAICNHHANNKVLKRRGEVLIRPVDSFEGRPEARCFYDWKYLENTIEILAAKLGGFLS